MRHLPLLVLLATCERQTEPAQPPASQGPSPGTPQVPANAEASRPASTVELGRPAPDFDLPDLAGQSHRLQQYRGKIVVLEWFNPECPFVNHAHTEGELEEMASKVAGEDLVWLAINSGAPGKQGHGRDTNLAAADRFKMSHPILLDETGIVGRSYGAEKTPHMFVIDPAGKLVYRGGIDNAPIGEVEGGGAKVNYVSAALADLRAGKPVTTPQAKPYGCTVKYGS